MKKLKCTSCGANLKIDENDKNIGYCEYCGSKYKLNDDLKVEIKLDDNIKDTLKVGTQALGKALLMRTVVIGFTILVTFGIIVAVGINVKNINSNQSTGDTQISTTAFNGVYELYAGTSPKLFINKLLTEASENNKKNDKKLTVIYREINTKNPDEIIGIKSLLSEEKRYEVILDYDQDGYVNKITITDID